MWQVWEERRDACMVLVGKLRETDRLENLGVENILKKHVGVDWIDLVQDTDKWWALVNAVMSNRIP